MFYSDTHTLKLAIFLEQYVSLGKSRANKN